MLFEDKSLDIIRQSIRDERQELEYQRDDIRDKLIDFYSGNQLLNEYLADYGFKDDMDKTSLPMMCINLTEKIIKKISLTYKYQPDRRILQETTEEQEDVLETWFAYNEKFAMGYKYAERYCNLLSKVLHRVHFNTEEKQWYPYIETYYDAHFLEDDPLHPYAYSYPIKQVVKSTLDSDDIWWRFWSDDFVFDYLPGTDKIQFIENFADDGINPFGIKPMVEMRNNFPVEEYDSIGAIDLIQANQNINIALNNLNLMIYYQAHDQIVISGAQPEEISRIKIGAEDPLVSPGDVEFSLLNFNPKITESIDAIKFNIQSIAYSYDLAINWALEYIPASGFSLIVQNIDLAEAREDAVELMKMHEKSMYKVLSKMQDYFRANKMLDDEPVLPLDAEISVDFEESLRLPVNQQEEIQRLEFQLRNNVITPVDLIQADNPDMSDEEAEEKYKHNKEVNGRLTAAEQARANLEQKGLTFEPNVGQS